MLLKTGCFLLVLIVARISLAGDTPAEAFGRFYSFTDVTLHANKATKTGHASYSLLDIPYSVDLEYLSEDDRYSYWAEPRYPGFYWAIAKTPTCIADGAVRRERFEIWYANQHSRRVYLHFYATCRIMRSAPSVGVGRRLPE